MDDWLRENLVCPLHKSALTEQKNQLTCDKGCSYPVVSGVPCMLVKGRSDDALLHGLEDEETISSFDSANAGESSGEIDGWVQKNIFSSNSNLFIHLGGTLDRYPIPDLPMEATTQNRQLLDIGCNWGRWSLSAAEKGYQSVGIDPWLPSVLAAVRVNKQLGRSARYLVADARYLPFRPGLFDVVFSYSTLQHLSKADVKLVLSEVGSVLSERGISKLHLLNRYGLRSVQAQVKRRFREPTGVEARYWSPAEMIQAGESQIGPSELEIDGFFTQGQLSDMDLLRLHHRFILRVADRIKTISQTLPPLAKLADQLFVVSRRPTNHTN